MIISLGLVRERVPKLLPRGRDAQNNNNDNVYYVNNVNNTR